MAGQEDQNEQLIINGKHFRFLVPTGRIDPETRQYMCLAMHGFEYLQGADGVAEHQRGSPQAPGQTTGANPPTPSRTVVVKGKFFDILVPQGLISRETWFLMCVCSQGMEWLHRR